MIWLLALQLAVSPAQQCENAKQNFAQHKLSEADTDKTTSTLRSHRCRQPKRSLRRIHCPCSILQ